MLNFKGLARSLSLFRPKRDLTVLTFCCLIGSASALTISGKVFHDRNSNGEFDAGESGLPGVAVSDGRAVSVTSKTGEYALESEAERLVFVTLPRGYRSQQKFYTRVSAQQEISFPLVDWPESRKDDVRFVQISDTHISGNEETTKTFARDIDEINTLEPAAMFALATGDLVNIGTRTVEYDNYVRSIADFKIPYFSLPGNHDARAEQGLIHYHRYLGPDYYSFNVGNCHFILLNSMRFDEEVQQTWIKRDLAAAPKGATLIVAFHYLPTESQLKFLSDLGAAAVLSGHWHGNRVREQLGVMDLNTPPLRFGGLDRHPRSFRILEVKRGAVDNELRLGGFNQHAVIVSPSGFCTAQNRKIPVVVNAYDSRVEVARVDCEVDGRRIRLKRASQWSWTGELKLRRNSTGQKTILAKIHTNTGETWEKSGTFEVQESGSAMQGPLRLRWTASTGGFMGFSSPRVGRKYVLIGVDDKGDLKNCGVSAFTKEGERKWHFKTDSAIKNNVGTSAGCVYATSVAGWLYALEESSGKLLWKAALDPARERWEVAATTVQDGVVYVGSHSYIAAFDARNGKRLWDKRNGPNDWVPSSYTVPTLAGDKLLIYSRHGAYAINAKTGATIWKVAGKFNGCLATDNVIYSIKDDFLSAMSLADGNLLWRTKEKLGDTCSSASISGDTLVVGTADGRITALSAGKGDSLWNFQTGTALSSLQPYRRDESDVNSSPSIKGNKVYIGSSDGHLYVLSLAKGDKLASHNLGAPIAASPLIDGNTLYLSAYDGNLYAFDISE